MLLPYFLCLGDEPELMMQLTREMTDGGGSRVCFFGRDLELGRLTRAHVACLVEQATRLERNLNGDVRPEVFQYLEAFQNFAGQPCARQQQSTISPP